MRPEKRVGVMLDVPGLNMLTVYGHFIGRTFKSYDWERTEDERHVSNLLQEIAQEVGAKSIQASTSCIPFPAMIGTH